VKIKSTEDRVIDVLAALIVAFYAICCLYPIVHCLSMSFSDDAAIVRHSVWLWPEGFNFESYKLVLEYDGFLNSFKNAVVYTVLGTIFSLFCNLTLGYVLSRRNFVFKKFLTVYILIPMMFSGGLIPPFLLIKSLGMYNTIWAIIIPGAVSVWNAILAKTFFQSTIPNEVVESAVLDGANDFSILLRIVLPLSTTIIAILALYAAVGIWNDYFNALIYLKDEALKPLQVLLKEVLSVTGSSISDLMSSEDYLKNYVNGERIKYVLIIVSCLPIMVIYPSIQKYFVKGVMLGSVKG
jgi:ABC-type glycerol-3-phosphate transport system permease component